MQVELLTLTGAKFSGEAKELNLKTTEGALSILPHHEPMTAIMLAGPVAIVTDNKVELFATFGGIVEVQNNTVHILADEADHADDLIESEIEAMLKKAQSLIVVAKDKAELHRAQTLVDRHAVRLEVSRIRRHHHSKHIS